MKQENRPLWKRVLSVIIPIVGLIFVVQSTLSLYSLWRRGDIVGEQEQRLRDLEEKQVELKNKLSNTYKYSFIEEEARNKLGLVKPGESIVYVEKEGEAEVSTEETQTIVQGERIFHQWLRLFF